MMWALYSNEDQHLSQWYYLGMTRKVAALEHFKRVDPTFYKATLSQHASLPVRLVGRRTRAELFAALVKIVISQQLGTAASDTIFARVNKVCGDHLSPESILKSRLPAFRKAGLSGTKTNTLKLIASAIQQGHIDLLSLKKLSEPAVAEILTRVKGLGPWSADMFMMHSLGREDIFSLGDLGLVRAMEAIYHLQKNTSSTSLLAIAGKWSPYRTYAALLLWRTRDNA